MALVRRATGATEVFDGSVSGRCLLRKRSVDASGPGDTTPRIINNRKGKSCWTRRPEAPLRSHEDGNGGRIATVRQMAQVITKEDADGRSYVRRGMNKLAELGLAETNGKAGKHPIWNLTPAGQKALADGNELPPRPKAGTGAKAVRAGFGPHGVAVTDMILAYGGRKHLTDWQVEVNHAIKETGLSFNTDAVLALPTKTSELRLFELDNGTMSQARLAKVGCSLDLTGVTIDGSMDFGGARFSGGRVSFDGARFSGGSVNWVCVANGGTRSVSFSNVRR